MALQKWLKLCYGIKGDTVRAAIKPPFTNMEWDNATKALLTMCADGMSNEDSDRPLTGGVLLRKRKVVWRSREPQSFLRSVRFHMGHQMSAVYADQDDPLIGIRPAPPCLPENFYDQEYVKGLSISAREQLNMK
jgi:hypothetical protein